MRARGKGKNAWRSLRAQPFGVRVGTEAALAVIAVALGLHLVAGTPQEPKVDEAPPTTVGTFGSTIVITPLAPPSGPQADPQAPWTGPSPSSVLHTEAAPG
jgi:hypothetical protein